MNTGQNPTDSRQPGSKRHFHTDKKIGIPLFTSLISANFHHITVAYDTVVGMVIG
jgi:hypothetical protein